MLVMLLLLLLLSPQGIGWLLLAMADPPIGRTAENRMLPSLAATKLLRLFKTLLGCSISSSRTWSRKPSYKLQWSLLGCPIARSVPVEWMFQRIMLQILSISLAWAYCEEEWKSSLRRRNTSVHALLTTWLMFPVLHLHCAPPPGPNSGGTLNSPVVQANRQCWMAIKVRAMNVRLILSINDLSFIPICCMP